ncbi:MAG: PIG-L family deacetylase [Nitrosomonas sp.]|nr:PIG-L family deacetylase [Nitrosomonas sp.]
MENLLVPYQAVTHIPATHALVLAPHPDDEVFGCGGAIMRHVEIGIPLHVIVVSDGAYGVSNDEVTDYIQQRQHESIDAAKVLGYGLPVFWQYRDREIYYGEKLIQEILTAIRETQADLIYAPSIFEMHPDHRAVGMATVEAVRRIGKTVRLALYEVGIPLHPNQLLNISDLSERKQKAMTCFVSQNQKQRYDLDIAALNRYRTYTLPAEVTAAEAYMLFAAEELANDPLQLYQSEHARQKSLGLALDSRDMPLVSVIIRSMDRFTLSDALDSVALQTYPNIEVVVVNAKGMEHRDIAGWCGRFPMRMVGKEGKSLNRSLAANTGLEAARGEYLIFLDDDDWFLPHHVCQLKKEFDNTDTTIAAYSAVQAINEQGEKTRRFEEDFDPIKFYIDNFIPINAVLFRRQAIDRGARFDQTLAVCEDWDFWLQVLEHGDFRFVANVGAIYRIEKGKGSGVWEDAARTKKMMTAIYRKWIPRWTDTTLWTVLEYARCKPILNLRELEIESLNEKIATRDIALDEVYQRLAKRDITLEEVYQTLAKRDMTLEQVYQTVAKRDVTLKEVYQTLASRDKTIDEIHQTIAIRDITIEQLDKKIEQLDKKIEELDKKNSALLSSTSWKITKPIRMIGKLIKNKGYSGTSQ